MQKPSNATQLNPNNRYKATADRIPTDRPHIIKIISAKEEEVHFSNGDVKRLSIAFDISEGEFKDYYKTQFEQNNNEDKKWKGVLRINVPSYDGSDLDNYRVRTFESNIYAVTDSNSGYEWDWDETKLKGKTAAMLFRNKEYEFNGSRGWWSEPFRLISVPDAEAGKYKLPKDKHLSVSFSAPTGSTDDGFMSIPEGSAEEIPF